jgi:hypothetical protein
MSPSREASTGAYASAAGKIGNCNARFSNLLWKAVIISAEESAWNNWALPHRALLFLLCFQS